MLNEQVVEVHARCSPPASFGSARKTGRRFAPKSPPARSWYAAGSISSFLAALMLERTARGSKLFASTLSSFNTSRIAAAGRPYQR